MRDWNVVATIHDGGFRRACRLLALESELSRTEFYNVVVMKVPDVAREDTHRFDRDHLAVCVCSRTASTQAAS